MACQRLSIGNLKVGLLGVTEAHCGRFGLLTDVIWVRLGDEKAVPVTGIPSGVAIKATVNTFTLTQAPAYRVYSRDRFTADLLGGFRYFHLGATINLNPDIVRGSPFKGSVDWVDGIAGARVAYQLTQHLNAFFLADAGRGGSNLTWQTITGIAYKVNQKTTLQFGYRRLADERQGGCGFLHDATRHSRLLLETFRLN